MTEFTEEKSFDRDAYMALISRIRYDKGDAASYENMLNFLWNYVTDPDSLEDREGILEEYLHWSRQLCDRCYIHMPHDLPYVQIRKCYECTVLLFLGRTAEGEEVIREIGEESFQQDGPAPKAIMLQNGKIHRPMSRLFIIYNYAKYYSHFGMADALSSLKDRFAYAFTEFADGSHDSHDAFLKSQMEEDPPMISYPVYDRVYNMEGAGRGFYIYYDPEKQMPVGKCMGPDSRTTS